MYELYNVDLDHLDFYNEDINKVIEMKKFLNEMFPYIYIIVKHDWKREVLRGLGIFKWSKDKEFLL